MVFNRSQNKPEPSVVCVWFDEQANTANAANATPCEQVEDFAQAHQAFVKKRVAFLAKQICRRKADITPLALSANTEPHQRFAELAQILLDNALQLHQQHHQVDAKTNKEVSIGLIRFAYINNITGIIEQLFASGEVPADTQIHLACYHSRQLLVLRNALEQKLDRILARQGDDVLCQQPEIQAALNASSATKHLFIVMATPVAEVGRDHDYDWAIVEPSSMRS
ncbi:MAG: type I-F CRISPR-associated helicase Cas3, partial [Gammaproteobacteria bacterium]